jgi:flagellar protein FliO/FliZ
MTRIMLQRLDQGLVALASSLVLRPTSVLAAAQTEAVKNTGVNVDYSSSGYLLQLIIGLVLVLVCIVALAWFAKRFRYMQSSAVGSMQVLGGISMGARERVVLMQVGSTRLLLGVAPGRINTLHVLEQTFDEAGSADAAAASTDENFAARLGSALLRGGKP